MPSVATRRGLVVAVPAEQPRYLLEAVRIQEAQHLELGALAGLEAAVGLEDAALAEHDRAVGLLAADAPHLLERVLAGQDGGELELERGGLGRHARGSAQGGQQGVRERRVGQADDLLDVVCDAVGQLVELAGAVGELDLEERQQAVGRERARVGDAATGKRARLGAEPALLAYERRQRRLAGHRSTRSR